jgi:hypothetical protein
MNKEQQKLLDDAYENYWNSHPDADKIFQYEGSSIVTRRMTEDEFVDMVKRCNKVGVRIYVDAIINHMKDTYGSKVTGSHHVGKVGAAGAEEVKKLTGKPSNADVVISTNHPKRGAGHALAHLEHVGASLKYSKASGGDIKIHSPSITHMAEIIDKHHEQMHGKSAGVGEKIKQAAAAGVVC